jgi:hypothetical protein
MKTINSYINWNSCRCSYYILLLRLNWRASRENYYVISVESYDLFFSSHFKQIMFLTKDRKYCYQKSVHEGVLSIISKLNAKLHMFGSPIHLRDISKWKLLRANLIEVVVVALTAHSRYTRTEIYLERIIKWYLLRAMIYFSLLAYNN